MIKTFLFLLYFTVITLNSLAQQGESDLEKNFRKGLRAAEENYIRTLQPKVYRDGSLYIDSAYGFRLRTDPGDSVIDNSSNGQMLIIIENHLFYARINSVSAGTSLKDYAKEQRDGSKKNVPEGLSHYKVSKLSDENYTYKYTVHYVSKDGLPTVSAVQMKYAQHRYRYLKIVALYPDDMSAAAQEERLDRLMRVLDTF
jgi:hypothetical protein